MLEFEEAVARVLAAVPATASERVSLSDAAGRVLLETVSSPIDLPPFHNSMMDGYAVRASDVQAASSGLPARLRILSRVPAGDVFPGQVTPGSCVRLFTGSPMPAGADAVVRQEDTRINAATPDEVLILSAAQPGEYVRLCGEDVRQGSLLLASGTRLAANQIGLLGAAGVDQVLTGKRPMIGLLATGSELTEPGRPLSPGHIYESNRWALAAEITRAGAIARTLPIVADTLGATNRALEDALNQSDVVVTSGGVSVGDMDFLKQAFEAIGGTLEFWKVAIKPGRPFVFGRCRGKLLFGLPGNPVSAFVTFLLLVRPALLRWQGASDVSLPAHPGVLAEPLTNSGGRRHFMRVKVDASGAVFSTGLQASHVLSSLAAANGLVDVPPDLRLEQGTPVTVLRWGY